jgi:hypothetical protein
MPLDRQKERLFRSHAEADDGGYMPGTPAERLGEVWELTKEAWSFAEGKDADQIGVGPRRRHHHSTELSSRTPTLDV